MSMLNNATLVKTCKGKQWITFRACLHGGGRPQVGEITCGGSPHSSCKRDQIKMTDYMDRRVTPPKQVTSPTWGPPPPCKQARSEDLRIIVRSIIKSSSKNYNANEVMMTIMLLTCRHFRITKTWEIFLFGQNIVICTVGRESWEERKKEEWREREMGETFPVLSSSSPFLPLLPFLSPFSTMFAQWFNWKRLLSRL